MPNKNGKGPKGGGPRDGHGGGLWGLLFSFAFFWITGLWPLLVAGP